MSNFQIAVTDVLRHEGGLENDKEDSGDITNFGVSLVFYKHHVKIDAAPDDIRNLKISDAEDIYKKFFWDRNRYDEINSQTLASKMLDLSVNIGSPTANGLLQKAVNAISPNEHLVVDGGIGIKTLEAINKIPENIIYNMLIAHAAKYYLDISQYNNNKIYIQGWITRLLN